MALLTNVTSAVNMTHRTSSSQASKRTLVGASLARAVAFVTALTLATALGILLRVLPLTFAPTNGLALIAFAALLIMSLAAAACTPRQPALPLSGRARTGLTVGLFVLGMALLAYGLVRWPHAPVTDTPRGFTDKVGDSHSAEDFLAFQRWERSVLLVGIGLLPFLLVAVSPRPKARAA